MDFHAKRQSEGVPISAYISLYQPISAYISLYLLNSSNGFFSSSFKSTNQLSGIAKRCACCMWQQDLIDEDECYVVSWLHIETHCSVYPWFALKLWGTLPKVCQIGRLKKGLSSSLASSKAPEKPLCPDLPTAAPLSTAGSTINSADDTRTAETGAAAETTTSAPISQELMHQARNFACDEAAMT